MTKTIAFALDNPTPTTLDYLPWGTRTLKLKVTSEKKTPSLRLRPKGVKEAEIKKGIFRAYADDSEAFIVSWGGGHEEGPCLKAKDFLHAFEKCVALQPGDASHIYFNVTHEGKAVPETAVLTMQAYDSASGEVYAELPVTLEKPAGYDDSVVRFQQSDLGIWQPQGSKLPQYASRWWPDTIRYVTAEMPPLSLQLSGSDLLVQWQMQPVATITDHTTPSILGENEIRAELFQFDEWHVALRIWFFWLDKNVGGGFFIGRHEVPDAERFDLLLRRRDGKVTLAATDLHWREVWGYSLLEEPVRATIGMGRETKKKLAEEKLGELWPTWKGESGHDHVGVHNPLEDVRLMADLWYGQEILSIGEVRAKGTEAHLPMIHNVQQLEEEPPSLTSSDVRLG